MFINIRNFQSVVLVTLSTRSCSAVVDLNYYYGNYQRDMRSISNNFQPIASTLEYIMGFKELCEKTASGFVKQKNDFCKR